MSYNGSGTFNINTTGQPVVAGTVISSSAFNSLTSDLATGLSTAITKDGQTTTTARITFAQGFTSSLSTDSSSTTTGSIITAGGVGIAKNLYVGGSASFSAQPIFTSLTASSAVATDASKGLVSVTNTGTGNNVLGTAPTISLPVIDNIKMGYSTTATAAGTTTLTVASNYRQFFTGSTTQTIVLPVTSTLVTGIAYEIENNSTGLLTVNSSGGNLVGTIPAGVCAHAVCIGTTLTTAADWDWDYISTTTITGTGANVLGTSPTITTPTISSLSSAAATALTLQSAGTTAITVDTSQNVGIGTASPVFKVDIQAASSLSAQVKNTSGSGYAQWKATSSTTTLNAGADNVGGFIETIGAYPTLFYTNSAERMRIDSSGNLLVGTTSGSTHVICKAVGDGSAVLSTTSNIGTNTTFYGTGGNGGWNSAATALGLSRNGTTVRSINAQGTINASGADYAEYMTKAGNFTIAKGDVVGINANGKLTNVFANAISFVVKSTDPSYVGGDVWGTEEAIGLTRPEENATQEEKDTFNSALETARQTVDRIAFSGQVPVNVTGATAGQYIIPVNDNGAIKGQAVSNPTFEQYQIAVGKVIAIESDGRAKIIVKVA